MADPVLARVVKTSYVNETLVIVEHGEEGPLVKWPAGVSAADAGDNLIACDEQGQPLDAGKKGKKAAPEPDPAA